MISATFSKAALSLFAFAFVGCVHAQPPSARERGQLTTKKGTDAKSGAANKSRIPKATGPVGFGGVVIGMELEQVKSVPTTDPVFVVGTLVPFDWKNTSEPPAGEWFKALLKMPVREEPFPATLVFIGGKLTIMSIQASKGDFDMSNLRKQIESRYGPGVVEDPRKEEQCIYQNGNAYTIKRGFVTVAWKTQGPDGSTLKTVFSDGDANTCETLRGGTYSHILSHSSLTISVEEREVKPATANPF